MWSFRKEFKIVALQPYSHSVFLKCGVVGLVSLKMSIFYSSHFLRIKSSTNAVDQLDVPREQSREKDDQARALEERFFCVRLVPKMWAADGELGRIRSSSLCCRGSFSFAEANVILKHSGHSFFPLFAFAVSCTYFPTCFWSVRRSGKGDKEGTYHTASHLSQ